MLNQLGWLRGHGKVPHIFEASYFPRKFLSLNKSRGKGKRTRSFMRVRTGPPLFCCLLGQGRLPDAIWALKCLLKLLGSRCMKVDGPSRCLLFADPGESPPVNVES